MKKYTIIPVFLLSAVLSLKAQDNAAVSSIAAAAGPEVSGNETSVPEVLRTASSTIRNLPPSPRIRKHSRSS